ncbi:MAG: ferrous iron transport protein B [Bacilli bacterium]|nr:ferrous iron transport protein B [Bacilli bacterium]
MKLALFGNQNSGKTSLFNALTGSNQKVGNWPGVTIDRVEGYIKKYNSTIVDLPGVYSLSPYTSEEEISRRFVLDEKIDLIINIVDATQLERSLYLTTQLLELDVDVVVALNMYDLLQHKGIKINIKKLEEELGVTIIPISAKTGAGINRLKERIFKRRYKRNKHKPIYPDDVEEFIKQVANEYKYVKPTKNGKLHKRFGAVKILEEDRDYRILMDEKLKAAHLALEQTYEMDGEQLVASLRYDYIVRIRRKCVHYQKRKETRTDKVDRIFLNKFLAIPIFILIMAVVYFVSISLVGGLTSSLIDAAFNGAEHLTIYIGTHPIVFEQGAAGLGPLLANWLYGLNASPWAVGLLTDGVIAGASAVISFVPQLIMLFICLSILETTGYMSRIAFFLDRVFHKIGLSGKSLIPFIVGAGCSVPGVMSTRIIEDENEKKATIALVPFIPCSAKLPIISLVCATFFPTWGFALALVFYLMAIVIIFVAALIIKKIIKHKEHSTFISELPSYKIPSLKYVGRDVGDKTWSFVKRAGTVVVFFSVIVCVLASFTWNFQYIDGVLYQIDDSMLAGIGNGFAWFFYPMLGCEWNWAASVSAIQGLIAKEQVVSSIRVIEASGGASLFNSFTPLTAFAYATFNLFSIPCVATISTMRAELKSVKKVILIMIMELLVAWLIASFIGIWGVLL